MRVVVGIWITWLFLTQDARASITIDLHCEGITKIINKNIETHREQYSRTFSIVDGVTGVMKWNISHEKISYTSPPFFPSGDYALLYEKMEHSITINRISGDFVERLIFELNQKLIPERGKFRYQISEGRCSTAKQKF